MPDLISRLSVDPPLLLRFLLYFKAFVECLVGEDECELVVASSMKLAPDWNATDSDRWLFRSTRFRMNESRLDVAGSGVSIDENYILLSVIDLFSVALK